MATLVFLLGKSHGQRSLQGHISWSLKESDGTEYAHLMFICLYYSLDLSHSPLPPLNPYLHVYSCHENIPALSILLSLKFDILITLS